MIKSVVNSLRSTAGSKKNADVMLHIGAPKCGTSAIQRFCVTHRKELLKFGYYYPEHTLDVNGVSGGHTQLAGALVNNKREQAASTLQRWLKEASKHDACLLLSAEALYGQHEAMTELCSGLDVRVVAFLRHPVDYLLANHNQGIKRHFSTQRLGALLPELLGRPTGHLAGLPLLHWAEAFGEENCLYMAYQSPSAGGVSVERHFLEALGISEKTINEFLDQPQKIVNRSYVKTALELKRLLNTVLKDMPPSLSHQVDWSLQGYSDRAYDESGFTMADLTDEMRTSLEQHLLRQMAPVVNRFPELKAAAEVPPKIGRMSGAYWLNLEAPLASLESDAPQVLQEIRQHAVLLRDQGRQDYPFCKLLDILGIEFKEPGDRKPTPGLLEHQRKRLSSSKTPDPDCLREMALLLERQGLLEDALFSINLAHSSRPSGKGIQQIKARMERKQKAQKSRQEELMGRTSKDDQA